MAGLAAGTLAGWQAYRWLRVAGSVPRYQRYWTRRRHRGGSLRYVALGDSLAQGVGASRPERGYVGLLADRLERVTGQDVEVLNLSVTGIMIADVVRHQLPALAGLDRPPDLVTVTVGTNDAGRLSPAALGERFAELCAGLPPGTLVADLPKFHRGRRAVAAGVAATVIGEVLTGFPRLVPVPLAAATAGTGIGERSADLFHPNDRGHRRYADAFWRVGGWGRGQPQCSHGLLAPVVATGLLPACYRSASWRRTVGGMGGTKLSVSLPESDVAFIDRYAAAHGVPSRSAAVQRAIALLRASELADAYLDAWQEWVAEGEAEAWEPAVDDGIGAQRDDRAAR